MHSRLSDLPPSDLDWGAGARACPANGTTNTSSVLKRFPDGVDISPEDVVNHEVNFGRYGCGKEQGDFYRLNL